MRARVPTLGTAAPVALGGETAHEPGLPLPWVVYPRHYGVFPAFAATEDGPYRLCTCTQPGLATAIADIAVDQHSYHNRDLAENYVWLPRTAARHLTDFLNSDDPDLFANAVCHRCQLRTPSLRWAHEMYETQFNQFYGWYTKQCVLRAGFFARGPGYSPGPTADPRLVTVRTLAAMPLTGDAERDSRIGAARREWRVVFQNEARSEFGYRNVGDAWIAETQLAALVSEIVTPATVERHLRPPWLDGLELDVWVPDLRLGFEYQGQQHFHPIKAWGGRAALQLVQQRDARKVELCRVAGVRLVVIDYTEPLTRSHVQDRMNAAGPPS